VQYLAVNLFGVDVTRLSAYRSTGRLLSRGERGQVMSCLPNFSATPGTYDEGRMLFNPVAGKRGPVSRPGEQSDE
jgi:hypothetical protein